MIKVIFKEEKNTKFGGIEYTYKDYDGVKVGDIVAVETRYGYAIAKVTQVDIIDTNFVNEQLKSVKVIVCSVDEMKKEQEKKQKYNELILKIKRNKIIKEIANLISKEELETIVEDMEYNDLVKFYNSII